MIFGDNILDELLGLKELFKLIGFKELFGVFIIFVLFVFGVVGFLLSGFFDSLGIFWGKDVFGWGLRRGFFIGVLIIFGDDFVNVVVVWVWVWVFWNLVYKKKKSCR